MVCSICSRDWKESYISYLISFIGPTGFYDHQFGFIASRVDSNYGGSGTASDPYVIFLAFEFPSNTISSYSLPGVDDVIACYVHGDTRRNLNFNTDLANINNIPVLTLVNSLVVASDDDISNKSTSRAVKFQRFSMLLTIIGVICYNF